MILGLDVRPISPTFLQGSALKKMLQKSSQKSSKLSLEKQTRAEDNQSLGAIPLEKATLSLESDSAQATKTIKIGKHEENREGRQLCEMAEAQWSLRNFDEAFRLWSEAVDVRQKAYGPRCTIVAHTLARRGKAHACKGNLLLAALDLERSIHIQKEKSLDSNLLLETASTQLELGTVLFAMGRSQEALSHMDETLSTRQEIHGSDHEAVAQVYCLKGDVHRHRREYNEAYESYQQALVCYRRAGLSNHDPEMVWTRRRASNRNVLAQRFWSSRSRW